MCTDTCWSAEETGRCEEFGPGANEQYSVSPLALDALADLQESPDPDGGEGDTAATFLLRLQYDIDEQVAYFAGLDLEKLKYLP